LERLLPQFESVLALPSERPGVMNGMFGHPPRRKIALKKCFTIDAENKITVHRSRKVARETGRIFATAVQFADLVGPDGKRLVEIWNGLPGVLPVAKFTHRKTARERIGKVLREFGEPRGARTENQPIPASTPPQSPGESAVAAVADQPGGAATTAEVPALGHRSPVLRPPGESGEERAQDCQEAHSANQTGLAGVTGVGTQRFENEGFGDFCGQSSF
jgi:hypothetical protein